MKPSAPIQTRRRSVGAYTNMEKKREMLDAQALAVKNELNRRSYEDRIDASQNKINALCKGIQTSYTTMVNAGVEMQKCENELAEKMSEEGHFHATADEVYPLKEVDETVSHKMFFRRISYYLLPLADIFFAWFALYPLIALKCQDLDEIISKDGVRALGAGLAIAAGLLLSLLSRMAVSSLDKKDKWDFEKVLRVVGVGASMLCLPMMYIVGQVVFIGGDNWTYSGCFAIISFIVQLLIVSNFEKQNEAFKYFQDVKHNKQELAIKDADEQSIRDEILTLKTKIQGIISAFRQEYSKFDGLFRDLAIAIDEHTQKFGKEPMCYLDQLVIYFGDYVCFHDERIPLRYASNGKVSALSPVAFPYVSGGQDIFVSNEFVILNYMMGKANVGLTLSETIRAINEKRDNISFNVKEENTSSDVDNNNPESTEEGFEEGGAW